MLVDHHCHLDFPDFAAELDDVVARARGGGRRHARHDLDADTRVRQGAAPSPSASTMSTARSARIRTMRMRNSIFRSSGSSSFRSTPRSSRSGRPVSTTITSNRHPKRRPKVFAATSPPRARRACRSKFIRATPTPTRSPSSKTSTPKGAFPAVLHCFTGGRTLAMRALELGLYVSFSGVITFKKSEALREIARDVPLD